MQRKCNIKQLNAMWFKSTQNGQSENCNWWLVCENLTGPKVYPSNASTFRSFAMKMIRRIMSKVLARAEPTRDPQETGIDMFPTLCFLLWGLYCIKHLQQKNIVYNVNYWDTTIALPSAERWLISSIGRRANSGMSLTLRACSTIHSHFTFLLLVSFWFVTNADLCAQIF